MAGWLEECSVGSQCSSSDSDCLEGMGLEAMKHLCGELGDDVLDADSYHLRCEARDVVKKHKSNTKTFGKRTLVKRRVRVSNSGSS